MFEFLGVLIEGGAFGKILAISASLSAFLIPWVTAGLTLWITAFGLATIRGEVQQPAITFAWRAVKVSMILYLALGTGAYQLEIVGTVNRLTAGLINVMADNGFSSKCSISMGQSSGSGIVSGVYSFLDCQFSSIFKIVSAYFTAAMKSIGLTSLFNLNGAILSVFIYIVGGIFLGLSLIALMVVMCVEWITVRLTLDIVLCLGPIFIAFLAFEPTKKYFEGWVSAIAYGIAMQTIFVLFLAIAAGAIDGFILKMFGSADTSSIVDGIIGSPLRALSQIFYLPAMILILAWVFTKLNGIAGGLIGHSGSSGLGTFAAVMMTRAVSPIKKFRRSGGKSGGGMREGSK